MLEQTNPDVGVVALDSNPDQAIELIERLTTEIPGTAILAASRDTDRQLISEKRFVLERENS